MPRLVALDSGPFAALLIPDDPHHQRAMSEFVGQIHAPVFTTVSVVTEVMYLLDFSVRNQLRFLEWLNRGAVEIDSMEAGNWSACFRVGC